MSLFGWAFKTPSEIGQAGLPEIFPFATRQDLFTRTDMIATYTKILTDAMDRTHGLDQEEYDLLWDSCVQTSAPEGLITLLACAMVDMRDLFIVYKEAEGVLRKATPDEEKIIRSDYKAKAESDLGIYVSFKCYRRTEMLRIYSLMEYYVLASLFKTVALSKAIQIKVNELRSSVSLADAAVAREQAMAIAKALSDGRDVMMDSKDVVETATPNMDPTQKAITFFDAKRAFILALPLSYISGEQTAGIGSTGEADMRAVERGLKQYFNSILHPVFAALFDEDTEFGTQDFREIQSGLEAAKTFDLISNDFLSSESKKQVLAVLFGLDPDDEKKNLAIDAQNAIDNPNPSPIATTKTESIRV